MRTMFRDCGTFNQPLLEGFNTATVTNMSLMFYGCSAYNKALPSSFNTAAVTNMVLMFSDCSTYNQALPSSFATGEVTNMSNMFLACSSYNQPLPSSFATGKVTDMSLMFYGCSAYNQALPSTFTTAAVTDMSTMFYNCSSFNQALPVGFTTAAVTSMFNMFSGCTAFNQNVGNFNIASTTSMFNMFQNSGISITNYDAILTAWNTAGYTNKDLGNASPLKYCASAAARANLVKTIANGGRGWTITGDALCATTTTTTLVSSQNPSLLGNNVTFTATVSPSTATGTVTFKDGTVTLGTGTLSAGMATFSTTALSIATHAITAIYNGDASNATSTSATLSQVVNVNPNTFITRWDLTKTTGSGANQISFGVATSGTVSYTWTTVPAGTTGTGTFTGTTALITGLPANAIIDLSINPTNFQRINIAGGLDKSRLTQLKQWGTTAWISMQTAFFGCDNFTLTATDVPILTGVTNMNYMFSGCISFNQALPEGFNTANVTDMSNMFERCTIYNQALPSTFNTAKVTDMSFMFRSCSAYNQLLPSSFNTAMVTTMSSMFNGCNAYNQPLPNSFNTANVTNMLAMFQTCFAYNQPLPSSFITDKVTSMRSMFSGCFAYNQPLPSSFNTAAVTTTNGMFRSCSAYNQPFSSSFNTATVTDMSNMFFNCNAYNQAFPNSFTTALVVNMSGMFSGCTAFNQNVGNFDITNAFMSNMFFNSGISITNYDAILTAWNAGGYTNKNLGNASPLKYCASATARANLVKTIANGGRGWTITGDTYDNSCIVTPAPTGAASQTFCAGKTVADLMATGTNIKWYDAATGGNLLLTSTVLINGIIYYATQTVSGVESTNRLAVTATVNALPTLNPGSNSPVCSGETLSLMAVGNTFPTYPNNNDTYIWTGVNSFTANTQNPNLGNVSMSANGIYTVSATNSANCSATATILVTVKQTPTLVVSNFTNPTPENNPDGTISFTTNLPNGIFSLSYGSTGSPKNVTVASGAFILNGLISGVYANFAVTNDGCTGRNSTEVTLLSTPFTLVKSIATGNWEASTTWNVGRTPKAGDVVIVDAGHAVTINANSTIKDMEVKGQLIYGVIGIIINLGL